MEKNRLDLSAFDLKLLAMAAMLADHIGYLFFPQALWMRCVGRLVPSILWAKSAPVVPS